MATNAICRIDECGKPRVARGLCESHYRRMKRHGDPLAGGTANGALAEWIDRVALQHSGEDCLTWPFGRDKDGYAAGGHPAVTTRRAYRAVCELVRGPAPSADHEAAHTCGRGRDGCVSPAHLVWKTHAENEADKAEHGTILKGSRHVNSRLTEDDVRAIRARLSAETHEAIAGHYGVARSTVSLIAEGATWGWLK